MMPQKFKSMLGIKDDQDLKMANNIWKMLDEMSSNDPSAYQKFIQKNLTQGLTDAKAQKQKKQKPYKIIPKQYILLQMQAQLQQQYLSKQSNTQLNQKLDMNINKQKWQDVKSKFTNKVNIYLNLCFTDRIKNPTSKSKKGEQIKQFNLSMLKDIQNLFYSLQGPHIENDKKDVWYFCMIFNTNFLRAFEAVQGGKKILLGLATAYFQQRLKADRNPVLMKVNTHALYQKNLYYGIQKHTIQVNQQKKYKYGKDEKPGQFLLEEEVDTKERQKKQKKQQNKNKKKQITVKTIAQEKKKQILLKPAQQSKSQNTTQQLPPLIPTQKAKQKKVLIQVLDQKEVQQTKDNISIPYQMKETENGYTFQFLVHEIQKIQDLDLQVSTEAIKLTTVNSSPQRTVQVKLSKKVDQNSVKAKMKKKTHTLQVTLNLKN